MRQGFTGSTAKKFFNWTYATTYAGVGLVLMLGVVGLTSWGLPGNKSNGLGESAPKMSNSSSDSTIQTDVPDFGVSATPAPIVTAANSVTNSKPTATPTPTPKNVGTPQRIEKEASRQLEKPLDTKTNTVFKVTPTPNKPVIRATQTPPDNKKKKVTLDDLLDKDSL